MSTPPPPAPPSKPLAVKHLTRARQNYDTYQLLKSSGQAPDWAVTILFYAALHLVQAYFVERAATAFDVPQTHQERTLRIGLMLLPAYPHYRRLENFSRKACYEPGYIIPTPDAVQKLEDGDFHPITLELRKRGIVLNP